MYNFDVILRPGILVNRIALAVLASFLFLLAGAFSVKISASLSRAWIVSFCVGSFTSVILARLAFSRLAVRLSALGLLVRNVIVIGDGEQARRVLACIASGRREFIAVRGLFSDAFAKGLRSLDGIPILGGTDDVFDYVRRAPVHDIVIALRWTADDRVVRLVENARELPVNVYIGADLLGFRLDFRPPPNHFDGIPIFEVVGRPLSGWGVTIKAIEDYALGTLAVLLLLPLMGIIALAIKLDTPGPVIFRQKRLGFNNKVFEILKFRTMHDRREDETKTVQARAGDPRISKVGRFLRRWSLDELPQLFNVLNGSMSLVGPRPHAIDHNEVFSKQIRGYFARHRVKPGITGWAQVQGLRGETDTLEKLASRIKYDIQYTENWSLFFDLWILIKTTVVCVVGRNAH
jgi:Undecaprenyl-phosphate glucose phosphotransferase